MELANMLLCILLLLTLQAPSMAAQNDSFYYDRCAPSICGNIIVSFPFSTSEAFCSPPGYEVSCDSSTSTSIPTLTLSSISFTVTDINLAACLITLSDTVLVQTLQSNSCDDLQSHFLTALNFTPFQLPYWNTTLKLALCHDAGGTSVSSAVLRYDGCGGNTSIYILPRDTGLPAEQTFPALPAVCSPARLPVQSINLLKANISKLEGVLSVLSGGFPLLWENFTDCWDCQAAGGRCGFNRSADRFLCFCRDGVCVAGGQLNSPSDSWKIIIGIVIPTVVVLLVGVIVFVKFRAKALSIFGSFISTGRSLSRTDSVDVKEFIKTYRSTWTIEFSHKELKKTTDGFKHKLGSGGGGNVYKGKLATGQFIAVKVLEKSSHNSRDFINEVATIGMIRHVNIIKLLGYCCDGPHRSLVYEFMPQGSLADLLSRKEDIKNILGTQKLFEIAIAVAQGIEYLHQGCDQRILHLDIKPQNVLLDSNLQPKISDFGLAKFYSKKDSAVSLTGARGTVGFIAPEVFMRNLGGASHKSDVYSYGMLLLEMIVGRNHCNSEHKTGETEEEAYFPDWIYDQMNKWTDMELDDSVVEFDTSVSRKMVMVGLWCIQVNPVDRPSISTAIGMLTGRLESIAMPPKPLLIFPPKKEMSQSVEACVSGGDLSLMSVGLSEITER